MSQTIADGARRQIPLSGIHFSVNAANFRPLKSRLITNVRCIGHVTSARDGGRPALTDQGCPQALPDIDLQSKRPSRFRA
jgi:hypothetical protein